MAGRIFGFMCLSSFIISLFTGRTDQLGKAVIDGAAQSVTLTVSLLGMMCLWCGVMRVFTKAGFIKILARIMRPIVSFLFPHSSKEGATEEISASICANLLGIGNAATPLAIGAMRKLREISHSGDEASDDMIMFTVLGTASLDIVPTTIIALRTASGSADPFEISIPIWISSAVGATVAVISVKLIGRLSKTRKKRRGEG